MIEPDNLPAARDLPQTDSWIDVLDQVGQLARAIAATPFVPQTFRGQPAAIAAAILTGRELGVQPMTSLAHIHVVNGRPGMSAQLMRQLILAAGHSLRYPETSDTRCVVEGRRRGETDWTRVSFTADQARKAAVQNMSKYPEDMLVARATSRLARRLFADCLGGVPYLTEELADLPPNATDGPLSHTTPELDPEPTQAPQAPQKPRRTAQRRITAPPPKPEPEVLQLPDPGPEPATRPQIIAIHARLNALGHTDPEEKHQLAARLLGLDHIDTFNDLTAIEASSLLDQLFQENQPDQPPFDDA